MNWSIKIRLLSRIHKIEFHGKRAYLRSHSRVEHYCSSIYKPTKFHRLDNIFSMSTSSVVKHRTHNILWVYLNIDKYLWSLYFVKSIEAIIELVYKLCQCMNNTMVKLFSHYIEAIMGALSIKGGLGSDSLPALPFQDNYHRNSYIYTESHTMDSMER